MASSSRASRIKGAMCVLVKDCILRSTKAGDVVVVIEHVGQSDNVQETLTLLVYEQSAASAANIVSRYYSRVEEHTHAEGLAKDNAIRRAKERTEPLNHAKLKSCACRVQKRSFG